MRPDARFVTGASRTGPFARPPVGTPPTVPSTPLLTTPLRRAAPAVRSAIHVGSRIRGERVVHARGRTVEGRLQIDGGAALGARLFDAPAQYDVLVRFSRAAGLPTALPDVHGLAVRVLGAYGPGRHQDLLLDSTMSPPLLRRLPLPSWEPRLYGSLLSYEIGGIKRLVGARRTSNGYEVLVSGTSGPWQPVGQLTLGDAVPAGRQIRFNVGNTGGGIELVGALQEWRRRSYDASHVGPDA
jgi:hypothetical protein